MSFMDLKPKKAQVHQHNKRIFNFPALFIAKENENGQELRRSSPSIDLLPPWIHRRR